MHVLIGGTLLFTPPSCQTLCVQLCSTVLWLSIENNEHELLKTLQ